MLNKMISLGAALAVLLAITQLALAQQNPDQSDTVNSTFNSTFQSPDGSQTPAGGQSSVTPSPSPDATQPNASQPPPPDPAQNNLDGVMHLNKKNELVVDCAAVADKLTQLNSAPVGTPDGQAILTRAQDLSKLCADSGFIPASSTPVGSRGAPNVANPNSTNSTVPNPNSTNSTESQQNQDTTMGGQDTTMGG